MHEHRFFIDHPLSIGSSVYLPLEEAHHAVRVLRVGVNDQITLFNGRGCVTTAHVTIATQRQVEVEIQAAEQIAKPQPLIHAHVPWLKQPQRLDWAIEKLAELGADAVGVYDLPKGRSEKRSERWRRLTISAAKQSGAAWLTDVIELTDPIVPVEGMGILLSEKPDAPPLREVLANYSGPSITLCVGPEAGITEEMELAAQSANWKPASLGPQRLRSETAAVVGVGAVRSLLL